MKIQPYITKLEKSKEYKSFREKYPDAFLVAGFFVLDLEEGNNVHQVDFYVPKEKKIAAFSLDGQVTLKLLDMLDAEKVPEKLDISTRTDLDALSGILTDEMKNRGISENLKKIIAVVQNIKGKKIWNLNCVLSGMEILKSHIEDKTQTVLKIEKTSLMEIMKKMPGQKAQAAAPVQPKVKNIEEELKKLNRVEAEIEKAKAQLKQQLTENEKVKK